MVQIIFLQTGLITVVETYFGYSDGQWGYAAQEQGNTEMERLACYENTVCVSFKSFTKTKLVF